MGTHLKCFTEALLMSTHNMFSWWNKKKYLLLGWKKNAFHGGMLISGFLYQVSSFLFAINNKNMIQTENFAFFTTCLLKFWEKNVPRNTIYRLVCCENSFWSSVTRDKSDWWLIIINHQDNTVLRNGMFVIVEVLRPSQPYGVMLSAVSLPNHTFTGQA